MLFPIHVRLPRGHTRHNDSAHLPRGRACADAAGRLPDICAMWALRPPRAPCTSEAVYAVLLRYDAPVENWRRTGREENGHPCEVVLIASNGAAVGRHGVGARSEIRCL